MTSPNTRGSLTPAEYTLLCDIRASDEDHGGLHDAALEPEEHEALTRLCNLGFVEALGEYGEAPDGEEDERDAGAATNVVYRITQAGVLALADSDL